MKKETKINILIAALAKLIAEGCDDKDKYASAPQITFLSETEVQFNEFPEKQLQTNKILENNTLVNIFRWVVAYYIVDEEKHYLECLYEEDEEAADAFDEDGIYDPDIVPGHIYHAIRLFKEFIDEKE